MLNDPSPEVEAEQLLFLGGCGSPRDYQNTTFIDVAKT